jgi:hypothetical protein
MLNLRQLNHANYNPEDQTVTIGGAANFSTVSEVLYEAGRELSTCYSACKVKDILCSPSYSRWLMRLRRSNWSSVGRWSWTLAGQTWSVNGRHSEPKGGPCKRRYCGRIRNQEFRSVLGHERCWSEFWHRYFRHSYHFSPDQQWPPLRWRVSLYWGQAGGNLRVDQQAHGRRLARRARSWSCIPRNSG